jgi:AMP nucleosidase
MPNATANGITIINFGMGSASAATIMDLLTAIKPEAVLFLGKCGGVKHVATSGNLVLPIAAIRGDGASNDYYPPGSARTAGVQSAEGHLHDDP